jgi:hypothetical protein
MQAGNVLSSNFQGKNLIYLTIRKAKVFGWLQCTIKGMVNLDYFRKSSVKHLS